MLSSAIPALADELDTMREVQARNVRSLKRAYDYIVVGAGGAGCTLVGTLAKREPSATILLIEAGAWDTAPSVAGSAAVVHQSRDRPGLERRVRPQPQHQQPSDTRVHRARRGRRQQHQRHHLGPAFQSRPDHWAAETGDRRWGYEHGLQLFKSIENWRGKPDPAFRGDRRASLGPARGRPAAHGNRMPRRFP